MKKLTVFILGNNSHLIGDEDVDVRFIEDLDNIIEYVKKVRTKYVSFIREEDMVTDRYIECILDKLSLNYDSIYIPHKIAYDYKIQPKILANDIKLKDTKPLYGSYIWEFVFKRSKLLNLFDGNDIDSFNSMVNDKFTTYSLNEVVYYHFPNNKSKIKRLQYVDIKETSYYKNIIYVGKYCNGTFNGYISWLLNIGRIFSNKYDITILYDDIPAITLNRFSKYFTCIKYSNSLNYLCDRLLVTYSTYYYPRNIIHLEHNYMFIHGIMKDYPNSCKYKDDIYDYYVAVSKTAAKGAEGHFPTKNILSIMNPFKLDMDLVKPHLKLVSAQRSSKIKRMDRIEMLAKALDEEKIPYTWNVFSDYKENTNVNGLVFRRRVDNPLPYVKDADYFVLLSDSESMSYSVVEALSLGTRVIVTDLDVYNEIGVNGSNGIIIPRNIFDNKYTLREVAKIIYKEKDKICKYSFDSSLYEGYKDIFI